MPDWHGILTPLVTPIREDETPDLESMARLVEFQVAAGVRGLWVMGTTGEFAAFTEDERAAVVAAVVRAARGRIPIIANVSDAGTRLAIRQARRAIAAGADAVAATPPYYYPHTQDELLSHYRRIAESVDAPLFVYHIPQTVRVSVDVGTVATLAREGVITGIKDSQNDVDRLRRLVMATAGLEFAIFAGTRSLIDVAVLVGAAGAIPNIANAFPKLAADAYESARSGDWDAAATAEARIIEIEGPAERIRSGSRNAASIGFLKSILWREGVISSPAVTSPLRQVDLTEVVATIAEPAG